MVWVGCGRCCAASLRVTITLSGQTATGCRAIPPSVGVPTRFHGAAVPLAGLQKWTAKDLVQLLLLTGSMDTNTLLIIIVVILLLGGGGFFFRRR